MLAEAATAASGVKAQIVADLKSAAAQTGADFHYLLGTAMRESGLKSTAQSATSSASGLFQFVDQTWLGLVKQYGAKFGFAAAASAIKENASGHYSVSNPADRQAILALRKNPRVASLMEGEYANDSRATLENALGRGVSDGELYTAHFLGAGAASKLIQMSEIVPGKSAASAFPQAADANRNVFFHSDGTPKSVKEVYDWATGQISGESSAHANAPVPDTDMSMAADTGDDDSGILGSSIWPPMQSLMAGRNADLAQPLISMTALPQAPFALTADVLDILGSLNPAGTSAHVS